MSQEIKASELAETNTHLENILLHFFESLPNPEAACAFLSTDERKVLEDALDAARERRAHDATV